MGSRSPRTRLLSPASSTLPSVGSQSSPPKVPRQPPRSPPQVFRAFQEVPQLPPVGQALIVPQARDAHAPQGVGDAEALLGAEVPQISGQVPRVECVAGPDGIHLRRLE